MKLNTFVVTVAPFLERRWILSFDHRTGLIYFEFGGFFYARHTESLLQILPFLFLLSRPQIHCTKKVHLQRIQQKPKAFMTTKDVYNYTNPRIRFWQWLLHQIIVLAVLSFQHSILLDDMTIKISGLACTDTAGSCAQHSLRNVMIEHILWSINASHNN